MKIQTYTDDGYQQVSLDHVRNYEEGIDPMALIESLYDKGVLSAADVNDILPSRFEVME